MAEPIEERVGNDDDLIAVLRFMGDLEKEKPPGAWMRGAAKILLVQDLRHGSGRRGSHPRLGSCIRIEREASHCPVGEPQCYLQSRPPTQKARTFNGSGFSLDVRRRPKARL
jgi:hypothetical protein